MRKLSIAVREIIRESLHSIDAYRKRTIVGVVGSAIGIGAFVCLNGVTNSSSTALIQNLLKTAGTTLVVRPSAGAIDDQLLSRVDLEDRLIQHEVITGKAVLAESVSPVNVADFIGMSDESGTLQVSLVATEGRLDMALKKPVRGAWIQERSEVVVSETLADRLEIPIEGVPRSILIDGSPVTVTGVIPKIHIANLPSEFVVVSPQLAIDRGIDVANYRMILDVIPPNVEPVAKRLPYILSPAQPELLTVSMPAGLEDLRASAQGDTGAMSSVLGILGLLVAAVGVTVPLTLSATERRAEFGLRQAMGASVHFIAQQLAIESVSIAVVGALAGTGMGIGAHKILCSIYAWPWQMDFWTISLAFAASLAVGLISCLLPIILASRVEPAEALKSGL